MVSFNSMFIDKAKLLYNVLVSLGQSSFNELKEKTNFTDVDLCMALCSLIKGKKIYQKKINDEIVYGIA